MDIFDQILENLELERDLGTRTVEMDRALLVPPSAVKAAKPEPSEQVAEPRPAASGPKAERADVPVPQMQRQAAANPPLPQSSGVAVAVAETPAPQCDIAFFTGRPLSPAGTEAMEKIFAAIRKIRSDAVICLNEERKARVYVLLGSDALKKRLPTARAVRGSWEMVDGVPAIMTFSPDYIFSHFQEGSSRMKESKLVMWNDIKSAIRCVFQDTTRQ